MRNKILIVDDVDINREILRSILEDEYTILEAENGKQALEIVDQEAKNMAAILLSVNSRRAGSGRPVSMRWLRSMICWSICRRIRFGSLQTEPGSVLGRIRTFRNRIH